jgi:hypothetical protein
MAAVEAQNPQRPLTAAGILKRVDDRDPRGLIGPPMPSCTWFLLCSIIN